MNRPRMEAEAAALERAAGILSGDLTGIGDAPAADTLKNALAIVLRDAASWKRYKAGKRREAEAIFRAAA